MDLSIYDWMERVRLVEWILVAGAVAGPAVCAMVVSRFRNRRFVAGHRPAWILAVLAGPLLYILWKIYNFVTDLWGLDSVAGLGVNALFFCAVGVALALLKARLDKGASAAVGRQNDGL